jgi:hypothetical protein
MPSRSNITILTTPRPPIEKAKGKEKGEREVTEEREVREERGGATATEEDEEVQKVVVLGVITMKITETVPTETDGVTGIGDREAEGAEEREP